MEGNEPLVHTNLLCWLTQIICLDEVKQREDSLSDQIEAVKQNLSTQSNLCVYSLSSMCINMALLTNYHAEKYLIHVSLVPKLENIFNIDHAILAISESVPSLK